jgi:catechol 2,3-dioxygenase-like lactoylglutathione lyase family enzyme
MAKAAKAKTEWESPFTGGFSSFSVDDLKAAKEFYGETLGLEVTKDEEGLSIEMPDGITVFAYPKEDHQPATFTILNLQVDDIETAVDALAERGIEFLQYDKPIKTDEKGIFRGAKSGKGPNIAWFEDPAGNILSVIET